MLFFGYFSCVIVAFTVVATWLVGLVNNSTLEKHPHPRPPIVETVTAEAASASSRAPAVSTAKTEAKETKHRKPKVLAAQRNNYGNWNAGYGNGEGNALGYAETSRSDPRSFFIH